MINEAIKLIGETLRMRIKQKQS